jgi:dihydrofolate reductase
MSTVIMHNVVSVDGFIADTKDQVGALFDWYVNGDVEILDGGQLKVSQASADYVKTMWAGIGSMVIGRHLFDITNGWEGVPPAGDHVVVVSHRPRPDDWQPEGFHPVHPRGVRRRTTSSAMWPRRSQRPRNSPGSAPSS